MTSGPSPGDAGRVGRWTQLVRLACLAAALAALVASALLLRLPVVEDTSPSRGWQQAADRIEGRLGSNEMVLVHYPSYVRHAAPLRGLPIVCAKGGRKPALYNHQPEGFWIVGTRKLSRRLLGKWREYSKRGTISFDDVHLHHGWLHKETASKRGGKAR